MVEQDTLGELRIVQGNTVGMVFYLFHFNGVLSLGYGAPRFRMDYISYVHPLWKHSQ